MRMEEGRGRGCHDGWRKRAQVLSISSLSRYLFFPEIRKQRRGRTKRLARQRQQGNRASC